MEETQKHHFTSHPQTLVPPQQDYKSNAEKARQELHMKDYKSRQLKIRFSSPGTALKIRNLSTWVTNELLEKAFSVSTLPSEG